MKKLLVAGIVLTAIMNAAQAADMPVKAPAIAADMRARTYTKAAAMAAPAFNWSGLYIGGHAGAAFMRNANATVDPADDLTIAHFGADLTNGVIPRSYNANGSGFVGGAQLGYNWQTRNYVYGLETDFSIPSAKAHQEIDTALPGFATSFGTFDAKVLWFGTTRARFGMLVDPRLLAYATGGLAYGSIRRQFSFGFPIVGPIEQTFADHTNLSWGWTAGAGLEWAVADHVTIRGEYQFVRLEGNNSPTNSTAGFCNIAPAFSCNFNVNGSSIDNHIVTIGINYMFGR